MVSDTFPFKKNLLKKIQLLSSLMDSNMKYLLFILLILFCSCYSGSSKKGQKTKGIVFVCKKNYMLYISMWIALLKLTPFCNNAFIVLELG